MKQRGTHDLAITNLIMSKTVIGQGYSATIDITVKNQGSQTRSFDLTIYANTSIIQTLTLYLLSGNSTTLTFIWNTSLFAKGNYIIWAYAKPVPGDTDTTDNTLVSGVVYVGMPGDVDASGKVNIKDIFIIAKAFGSNIGDSRYNPNADINCDGKLNISDIYSSQKLRKNRHIKPPTFIL